MNALDCEIVETSGRIALDGFMQNYFRKFFSDAEELPEGSSKGLSEELERWRSYSSFRPFNGEPTVLLGYGARSRYQHVVLITPGKKMFQRNKTIKTLGEIGVSVKKHSPLRQPHENLTWSSLVVNPGISKELEGELAREDIFYVQQPDF